MGFIFDTSNAENMNIYHSSYHPYEPSLYASSNETIMDKCTRCGNWTNVDELTEIKPTEGVPYTQMVCEHCMNEDKQNLDI